MMGVNTGISFARSMSDVEPYMRLSAAVVQMAVRDYGKAVRAGDERHAQKIHAEKPGNTCRDHEPVTMAPFVASLPSCSLPLLV